MLLEVKDLHFSYGKLKVLWGVNLKINEGELVALLGSNGMGKTTTLKNIIGILRSTEGEIFFEGENISHLPPYERIKRGMILVSEGDEIFPYMTVRENLELGAYLPRAREKIEDSLDLIYGLFPRLKEREKQIAGTLSGGERRMLAIARGLMGRPKLMMLDEPSLGLAPKLVSEVLKSIKELNEQNKISILLVEQNVRATLRMCHRGYLLENGRTILEDSCSNLLGNSKIRESYLGM